MMALFKEITIRPRDLNLYSDAHVEMMTRRLEDKKRILTVNLSDFKNLESGSTVTSVFSPDISFKKGTNILVFCADITDSFGVLCEVDRMKAINTIELNKASGTVLAY